MKNQTKNINLKIHKAIKKSKVLKIKSQHCNVKRLNNLFTMGLIIENRWRVITL